MNVGSLCLYDVKQWYFDQAKSILKVLSFPWAESWQQKLDLSKEALWVSVSQRIVKLQPKLWTEKNATSSKYVLWVSVGQRVAKLQAVKVGDFEKNSAAQPESNHTRLA